MSEANPSSQGHISDADINKQPPFPGPGLDGQRSPPPKHPHAEQLMNTAVRHIFPEQPAPSAEDDEDKAQLNKPDGDQREAREEEPLLRGTPLDELTTPGIGLPASEPKVDAIKEEPSQDHRRDSRMGATKRPNLNATRGIGSDSVRMGTSALFSALNSLPLDASDDEGEDDYEGSSSDEDSPRVHATSSHRPTRPTAKRLGSSLHTIRPMATQAEEDMVEAQYSDGRAPADSRSLKFPFRANTVARKARSPGPTELQYQLAKTSLNDTDAATADSGYFPDQEDLGERRSSGQSELSIGQPAREMMQDRIQKEEDIGAEEEAKEMSKVQRDLTTVAEVPSRHAEDDNTSAALREGSGEDEVVEDRMMPNPSEKKRLRKEQLAEKLQEVFGLAEREEVIDEMRCWLLRSIMLKGYMYITARHICFYAHMPARENAVVRTGPLYKKASRTKMNTKFWVVLRNDVLSWFESTADPYFPKGNISLQYVSSCDPVDETRFKLRTPERNYTFKADTADGRDEWVKSIQKVMFKTQHEGESVKLIIPLEAVLDVEKSPTLEFAETIEIRCVDSDDQMSIDSYFFASFQDGEKALKVIQTRLDERPSSDLPANDSAITLPTDESAPQKQKSTQDTASHAATSGFKKLGSLLKPILHGSSSKTEEASTKEKSSSGVSLPFIKRKTSTESMETLTPEVPVDDGYPPRQAGTAPPGMNEEKGWGPDWIRKPVSKILPTSASTHGHRKSANQTTNPSEHRRASDHLADQLNIQQHLSRNAGRSGVRETVTEVVEPTVNDGTNTDSDHDADDDQSRRGSRAARFSFNSSASIISGKEQGYSMMEQTEEDEEEYAKTAKKFRSVFSLNEKEELIDHFPGFLYRVLPVSGRFFISPNYFCFRSSQLLYKTKMIIPIRDIYGLKAQKAFRFGHHGLIVVIKGHEEIFLEFSSTERREACVTLLEQLMEDVRVRAEDGDYDPDAIDADRIQARIMEDLDASIPLEPQGGSDRAPPVSPSPLFGSTTSTFLEFKPEPMRITCLTIGSRGDVQPYIALCKGLQAEGHTTRIATHGEYKEWVEGHGIEFASVGGDPAELMAMCVENGMFTVSFLKEGISKFRGWLDELLRSSWDACQSSDLLIESPSAMGGVHIAEALRIPYFRAFTMPWTRTRAYPHAFAVPEHKKGGAYNYMTYTMFDQVFWRAISGQVNRFRKDICGIEATNYDKLEQHKIPFLYNFSPSVVHPPLDWTEWIHVTGYWFLENADESAKKSKWTPPDGLLDFIEEAHVKGKKVVYIGFGSIVVSDPEEMTRCVVDAVKESGCYAILSKGWSDRGSKKDDDKDKDDDKKDDTDEKDDQDEKDEKDDKEDKEDKDGQDGADGVKYPKEIYAIDSIDHSWLFPRIDAACHHGGAGTSGASLRAGIPTIIKPFFGDQAFWSERVESLGVGSAVRKLTAEHLTEALLKATTDEKQIAKAKIVGEMIRKENGVAKAIEAIYRDLEYAKSIVKPASNKETDHDGPLNKVTSLLHPITSSDSSPFRRSRSRKSGGEKDQEKLVAEAQPEYEAKEGDGSEESWDVVSTEGTEEEKETSQSPVRTKAVQEASQSDPQPQAQAQSQGQFLGLGKPLS